MARTDPDPDPASTALPPPSSPPSPPPAPKRRLPTNDDDDDDDPPATTSKRPKPTPKPTPTPKPKPACIAAENALLLQLKDDARMGWPAVAEAFQQHGWAGRGLALLKSRYRSLKNGSVFWEDGDVDFMHEAVFQVQREYDKSRWECIAERMAQMGASRRFTGAACEKRFFRMKAKGRKEEEEGEEGGVADV